MSLHSTSPISVQLNSSDPQRIRFRFGNPCRFFGGLVLLLAVATTVPLPTATAAESAAPASGETQLAQDKLDSLLAPVALYPDQLLTQTLMAATYPLDVVEAARFVKENKDLKGDGLDKAVAEKNWDPSVQSLTAYPQVLEMMSDKLEWTQELGNAFLSDEKRVLQTVQTLRQKAEAEGNLKSNDEQKVVKEQSIIIIEPAKPDVVYVPTYNPTIVYGAWWAPAYPPYYWPPPPYYYPPGSMLVAGAIGFGIGVAISNNHWGWCSPGWHGGDVNINVNRNNTFINNNANFKKNVNNGNWQHNPAQRKGVAYGDARTRDQYRKADPNAVSSRRDARGFESGARSSTQDAQRPDRGGSAGTRDMQRPGGGGDSKYGGSAGSRDMQRPGGSGDSQFGGSAGTRDTQRSGGGGFSQSSGTSPSFNASQSRQQTQNYSNRGASSRSTMGGSGGYSGGGRSGGGRSGGGRGR